MAKQNSLILGIILTLFLLGGVSAVGTYPAVDPNMVLYYHFNNQSDYGENDTNVYDFSGNGNNGTANNTLFQAGTGVLGDGSFYFNGVNSSIYSRNSITDIYWNKSFSVSVWINISSFSDSASIIAYPRGTNNRFSLGYFNNSGNYEIDCGYYNGTNSYQDVYAPFPLSLNTNYHIVCVHNGTTGNNTIYINGFQYKSPTTNAINPGTSGNLLYIGNDKITSPVNSHAFSGNIDEFYLWNKTLNSTYVLDMFNDYSPCGITPFTNCVVSNDTIWNNLNINIGGFTIVDGSKLTINNSVVNFTLSGSNVLVSSSNLEIYNSTLKRDSAFWVLNLYNSNFTMYNSYVQYAGSYISNPNMSGIYGLGSVANVYNSVFNNTHASLRFSNSNNSNIINNSFYNIHFQSIILYGFNNRILNNNMYGNCSNFVWNGYTNSSNNWESSYYLINFGGINTTVSNNYADGKMWCRTGIRQDNSGFVYSSSNGNIISNNRLYNFTDQGIYVSNVSNGLYIFNNTIVNVRTCNGDCPHTGDVGILLEDFLGGLGITFNTVSNNYISLFNHGIELDTSNNNTISYNTVINSLYNSIKIYLKSSFNLIWSNNVSNSPNGISMQYNASYNNLSGNIINNNNVQIVTYSGGTGNYIGLNYYGFANKTANFDPTNQFVSNSMYLNNALLTNGTSLCNGTTGLVTGDVNITLNPNDFCYVLDNFNVTEGVWRQYSIYDSSTGKITGLNNDLTIPTYNINRIYNGVITTGTNLDENGNGYLAIKGGSNVYIA